MSYHEQPSPQFFAVTPDNANDLTIQTRGLYVGGTGDVKVTSITGDVVTFVGVPAGMVLPIRVKRVWATGTTATAIVGLA